MLPLLAHLLLPEIEFSVTLLTHPVLILAKHPEPVRRLLVEIVLSVMLPDASCFNSCKASAACEPTAASA